MAGSLVHVDYGSGCHVGGDIVAQSEPGGVVNDRGRDVVGGTVLGADHERLADPAAAQALLLPRVLPLLLTAHERPIHLADQAVEGATGKQSTRSGRENQADPVERSTSQSRISTPWQLLTPHPPSQNQNLYE